MDITALKLFERIPTLNENNWPIWKWKVELALQHMEMWPLIVDDNDDDDTSKSTGQQPNDDIKIRSLIGLWVDDSLVPLIKDCKTSHQMWTKLSEHFKNGLQQPTTSTESKSSIPNENLLSKKKPIEIEVQPTTSTESKPSIPNENSVSKDTKKKQLKCNFCEHEGHTEDKCWRKKRIKQKLRPFLFGNENFAL
ncbi:hypothetical protein BLA29_000143 [Euroglyphus maynei]|uniref:DUF4219 domain-containing protein n=1 Tax=Euroglyphus maynei TaxID=6958 RepID=A0A1Y3BU89_EURMA|nr:hypothetical protein BLA29_000143 [Euroglyphus maynei]